MGDHLSIWTVYDHPRDHPAHFVVRVHRVKDGQVLPDKVAFLFKELETARAYIQQEFPGGHQMPRFPDDDPVIVEAWI